MKNTHTQSRKILFQLFSVFGELSKCFLTVLFGNLKMKRRKKKGKKGGRERGRKEGIKDGRGVGKKGRKKKKKQRKRTEN